MLCWHFTAVVSVADVIDLSPPSHPYLAMCLGFNGASENISRDVDGLSKGRTKF
jgi:hypothetical protein